MNQQLDHEDFPTAEDISAEIWNIKACLKEIRDAQPHRAAWRAFPDVLILKDESIVKQDPPLARLVVLQRRCERFPNFPHQRFR